MGSALHYRTTEFSVKEKRIGSKNTLHLANVSRIAKYNKIQKQRGYENYSMKQVYEYWIFIQISSWDIICYKSDKES